MIEEDIEKDIREATEAEDAAKADFEKFKSDIKAARDTRKDKKQELDDALAYLRSIAKGCDYMAANFEFRLQQRYEEIDGILEAEAALKGGVYARSSALLQGPGSC